MLTRMIAVALVLLLALEFTPPLRAELKRQPVFTVQVRSGVTVKYLRLAKCSRDTAVVLFAGGDGLLNLDDIGTIGKSLRKFPGPLAPAVRRPRGCSSPWSIRPIRSRSTAMSASRRSTHKDMGQVIADVRGRVGKVGKGGKVWLVGTSSGTLSVAGVASQLPAEPSPPIVFAAGADPSPRPDGVVLTSTQSVLVDGLCGRTVFDANLAAINVPALAISHLGDKCRCSPPKPSTFGVVAALKQAPAKKYQTFSGGLPPLNRNHCQAMTPHGFRGLENKVVGAIYDWIRAN